MSTERLTLQKVPDEYGGSDNIGGKGVPTDPRPGRRILET